MERLINTFVLVIWMVFLLTLFTKARTIYCHSVDAARLPGTRPQYHNAERNREPATCIDSADKLQLMFIDKTSPDSDRYWKWIRPSDTVEVTVGMEVKRLSFYNDLSATYDIMAMFEIEWIDERLMLTEQDCDIDFVRKQKHSKALFSSASIEEESLNNDNDDNNNNNQQQKSPTIFDSTMLEGNAWHFSRIWSPSLRVARNHNSDILHSDPDSQILFIRVNITSGAVRVNVRSRIHLFCPMDYRKYPFDSQVCSVTLMSNDLSAEKMILRRGNHDTNIAGLYMSSHSLEDYDFNESNETVGSDQFSALVVRLYLKRQWGHHMLVIFFPSMLIVATSWISFWMEITSPPARITLCVTTLLALVTVSKEVQQDLPKLPYIKAADLWFVGCILSIFFALIEYIIVAYTFRAESAKIKERKRFKRSLSSISLSSLETASTLAAGGGGVAGINGLGTSSNQHFGHNQLAAPNRSYSPLQRNGNSGNNLLLSPTMNAIRRQSAGNALHRNSLPSAINNAPSSSSSPPRIHFTFSPPDSPSEKSNSSSSPDSLARHFAALSSEEIAQLAKSTPQEIAESIDRKARIVFPFFFFLFNLIYWTCYI